MPTSVTSAVVQVPAEPDAPVALTTADGLASQIAGAEETLGRISRATLAKAFGDGLVPTEAGLAADRNALQVTRDG